MSGYQIDALKQVNNGLAPDDGSGDSLRTGAEVINNNFNVTRTVVNSQAAVDEITLEGNGLVVDTGSGASLLGGSQTLNANSAALAQAVNNLAASQAAGTISYLTLAAMNADLTPADGVVAYVTNDSTVSNNGWYRKNGASGAGSWGATVNPVSNALTTALGNPAGFQQAGTGSVLRSIQNELREVVSPTQFGAAHDGVTDDRSAIVNAIAALPSSGGTVLFRVRGVYAVDPAAGPILIPSNVTIDLNGSTIQRIGTNYTNKIFSNQNYGVSTDSNVVIKNGTIIGTGASGTVSDQGAAIGLWKVNGWRIENVTTSNTNGDGIQYRQADNGVMFNVEVKNYGRNGVSPTSGSNVVWQNVNVSGVAITGANPGKGIDAENNAAGEVTKTYFNNVKATDITFTDFHGADGDAYSHEAVFSGCSFGFGANPSGQFTSMSVKATNKVIAANFVIDAATRIGTLSTATSPAVCLNISNVSGCKISSQLVVNDVLGDRKGIVLVGTCDNTSMTGIKRSGAFNYGLMSFAATDLLTNSTIRSCDFGNVYLTGASNTFDGCNIGTLTVSRAASTGNSFIGTTNISGTMTAANGADLTQQTFSTPSSWTPTVQGATTAGTCTYATRIGYLAKVGSIVYFNMQVSWTAHTGTGALQISGLPFIPGGSGRGRGACSVYSSTTAWTAGSQLFASISDSLALVSIMQQAPGSNAVVVPVSAAGTLVISGHYFV